MANDRRAREAVRARRAHWRGFAIRRRRPLPESRRGGIRRGADRKVPGRCGGAAKAEGPRCFPEEHRSCRLVRWRQGKRRPWFAADRSRRKTNHYTKAWFIILDPQASIVETCHRHGERKPEAGSRARASVFEPDESIEHAQAIVLGDARTAIRDDEFNIAATPPRREFDDALGILRRRSIRAEPSRLRHPVFQRIVEQIGDGRAGTLPASMQKEPRLGRNCKHDAAFL